MSQIGPISPERVSGPTSQRLCIVGGRTRAPVLWSQRPHFEQLQHNFQRAGSGTWGSTCMRVSLWGEQIRPQKAHSAGVWWAVDLWFSLFSFQIQFSVMIIKSYLGLYIGYVVDWIIRVSDMVYIPATSASCIWWCLGRKGDSISGWRDIFGVPRMGR